MMFMSSVQIFLCFHTAAWFNPINDTITHISVLFEDKYFHPALPDITPAQSTFVEIAARRVVTKLK